ncbi:hypothetical protein GCM10029976_079810 [Kribbella albertanoniae]
MRGERWARPGPQTIAIHTGPPSAQALWWSAIFEIGGDAALDGSTALRAAGLSGFDDVLHVSVPKSWHPRRARGVVVHETRRRKPDDLEEIGLPRTRPPVAAVRAALWARSDRQAATILAMSVQQGLTTAEAIAEAFATVRRDRRRRFIATILPDLAKGAQSIGELDFAQLCRDYGLPEPDRQTRRRGPDGTWYLDTDWTRYDAVVEIEGVHHLGADQALSDASRQNELTIGHSRVLRIPVIGLRVAPDHYMSQVARLLRSAGWPG